MKIVFYNPCNSGDTHVCRSYIMDFVEQTVGQHEVFYSHKESITRGFILSDIKNLKREYLSDEFTYENRYRGVFTENDVTYVNTWYCVDNGKYFRMVGLNNCNFYTVYELFKDVYIHFGLTIREFPYYLPKINLTLKDDMALLLGRFDKTILICNSDVKSGQAENFGFYDILEKLSDTYKHYLFLTTKYEFEEDNVIDISKLSLNEMGCISCSVDVIVGRASGPYSFSVSKANIEDPNKSFVCFTTDKTIALGLHEQDHRCKLYWSNNFNEDNVFNTILEAL